MERQQAEIDALQQALAEQKEMLASVLPKNTTGGVTLAAAGYRSEELKTGPSLQATENQAVSSDQQRLNPEQIQVEEELQRGPEIADVTPDTPALKLGPA